MSSLRSLAILMSLCVAKLILSIDAASVVVNETVGGRAILKCHTSQRTAVDWWYQRTEGDNTRQICLNGEVVVEMRSRFSICSQTTGDYNLVIEDVDLTDSGVYTCVEDAGLGQRTTLQLLVAVGGLNQSTSEAVQVPEVDQCTGYRERGCLSVAATVALVITGIVVSLIIVVCFVFRKKLRKIVGRYPMAEGILSKCPGSEERHASPAKSPARTRLNRSIQTTPGLSKNNKELETLLSCEPPPLNDPVAPIPVQPTDEPISTSDIHDASTPKGNPNTKARRPRREASPNDSALSKNKENQQNGALDEWPKNISPVRDPKKAKLLEIANRANRDVLGVKNTNEGRTLLPHSAYQNDSFSEV